MAERTEQTSVSTDQNLDATDARGLKELNKAFDDSFGPKEGATPPPEESRAPKEKTRQDAPGRAEAPSKGHHAPVEVKSAPAPASARERAINLLGEPEYEAKQRERKPLEFDEEIPSEEKKTQSFPGRDEKGKFKKPKAEQAVEMAPEEGGKEDEEEEDPDVDAVQVKPNAHPAVKEGFRQLRTIAKARRAEIKALTTKTAELANALETLKKAGIPPEIEKELTRLRATSQRFDLLNDGDFKTKYENPIEAAGERILKFCVDLGEGSEDMKKWAEEVRKHGFKNLSTDYWDKEIIPKVASVTNQQRVAQLAADLHSKIDERNRIVTDYTASPDKINEYRQQQAIDYYQGYQRDAQDEAEKLVKQIGPWAQLKDANTAKTDEERATFDEHNNRVEGYKTIFEKTMGDLMHGGPRKHVRIVAQAVYGMELDRQLKELQADYDAEVAENEALRHQLNRVTRARSVPGRAGGGVDVKPPQGLSTKDARTALKEYFSGGGS